MTRPIERSAFTLIEVLVVTAIIGMLAGLLLSALGQARARGQSARCISNLRQWGLALEMYIDDHDEYIPRRGQGVQPLMLISRPEDWFNCLPRYFNGQSYSNLVAQGIKPRAGDGSSIFIDPAAKDPGGTYFLPYGMNMYLSPWIRPQQHKLSEIPNPGQLAFMADASGPYASTVPSQLGYTVVARHAGRANVVFVDGRVQSFDGSYLGCGVGEQERPDSLANSYRRDQPGAGAMKQRVLSVCFALILSIPNGCAPSAPPQKPVVRVAVIGGMIMTGMWQELAKRFEADTGYTTKITMAGNKQVLVESFHKGEADFVTLHASDEAANLVADGFAVGMRPWARNELIIVGPVDDPAHIKGMTDGAAALRKIAEAHAPYVDFNDGGARQIADKLWKKAGITPKGEWVIKDESDHPQIVTFAQKHHAYVIVGRIPVVKGKIDSEGMEIMVRGDPDMLRPFVAMIANVNRFPRANVAGAQILADYLLSEKGQQFLKDYAAKQPDGVPLFYPINFNSTAVNPS